MTHDEAMKKARDGFRVREKAMSRGWTIAYIASGRGFFCINPHTGSNYLFRPKDADKASNNWSVVS